jgi:hypothetical protein
MRTRASAIPLLCGLSTAVSSVQNRCHERSCECKMDDRLRVLGVLNCDFIEMKLRGFAVANQQHEGPRAPRSGADHTEQIGLTACPDCEWRQVMGVSWPSRGRVCSTSQPAPSPEHLYRGAGRFRRCLDLPEQFCVLSNTSTQLLLRSAAFRGLCLDNSSFNPIHSGGDAVGRRFCGYHLLRRRASSDFS